MESFSTIVDCNGSLDSGDIIGGDGELNWVTIVDVWICWNSAKETNYKLFINGVETI